MLTGFLRPWVPFTALGLLIHPTPVDWLNDTVNLVGCDGRGAVQWGNRTGWTCTMGEPPAMPHAAPAPDPLAGALAATRLAADQINHARRDHDGQALQAARASLRTAARLIDDSQTRR